MNLDLFRLAVILELALLMGGGAYLHAGFSPSLPRYVRIGGYAVGWVLLMTAVSVVLNLSLAVEETPGLRLFAVVTVPAVVVILWAVAKAVQSRTTKEPHHHGP